MAVAILSFIAIPTVAFAYSRNSNPKQKPNPQTAQNIHNEIEKETKLPPFPKGEPPAPVPKAQVIKPVARPSVSQAPQPTGTCVDWIKQAGISDVTSAYKLIMRESGCRVNATNRSSGAYGIPQSLPASKMASFGADYRTNPITQLRWMNSYVLSRYHSWAYAYSFQISHGWY